MFFANVWLAADVQGLLGKLFEFVSSLINFHDVYFESLGLHGFGCKLVMGGVIFSYFSSS